MPRRRQLAGPGPPRIGRQETMTISYQVAHPRGQVQLPSHMASTLEMGNLRRRNLRVLAGAGGKKGGIYFLIEPPPQFIQSLRDSH